jgi:hypothetical protein
LSSILKALKKLEEEYPHRTDAISWPRKLGPTRIIRRWEIHSGRFTRILWGSLGLIVLAAAGWVVFYMQRPIAAEPNSVPAVTMPEPVYVRKTPLGELPKRSPAMQAPPRTDMRKAVPESRIKIKEKTPTAESTEKQEPSATQLSSRPQPQTPDPKARGRAMPIPTGLTLQAISWSEQEAERLAVINNQIVREGTTFEGYNVVRIETERVLLRKNGEAWALAFKLQKTND